MAIAVNIDFNNVYRPHSFSGDMRTTIFQAELLQGKPVPLMVEISSEEHELLPNVYNLAFGPIDSDGHIDDKALLSYKDYSKVFSTILAASLRYLDSNKERYIGIDGSNNARAFLYYRFIQRNYDYLDHFVNIYGLKYFVRITRFGKRQYDNPFDFDDVIPSPVRIQKGETVNPEFMYNYFIFNKK